MWKTSQAAFPRHGRCQLMITGFPRLASTLKKTLTNCGRILPVLNLAHQYIMIMSKWKLRLAC